MKLGATNVGETNQRIIFKAINTGTAIGTMLGANNTFRQLTVGGNVDPYGPNRKSYTLGSSRIGL